MSSRASDSEHCHAGAGPPDPSRDLAGQALMQFLALLEVWVMRTISLLLCLFASTTMAQAHTHHHGHGGWWPGVMATWYGPGFYGHRTACGEIYTGRGLTTAHRTLPCGTHIRVTNLQNGRSAVLTVNDRGPYRSGAVLDLSPASRNALGARTSVPVRWEVVR